MLVRGLLVRATLVGFCCWALIKSVSIVGRINTKKSQSGSAYKPAWIGDVAPAADRLTEDWLMSAPWLCTGALDGGKIDFLDDGVLKLAVEGRREEGTWMISDRVLYLKISGKKLMGFLIQNQNLLEGFVTDRPEGSEAEKWKARRLHYLGAERGCFQLMDAEL